MSAFGGTREPLSYTLVPLINHLLSPSPPLPRTLKRARNDIHDIIPMPQEPIDPTAGPSSLSNKPTTQP